MGEHGRLWVVGSVGDSTFVDVFSDTTFLVRFDIDCLNEGWGHGVVQGHWLALQCKTDSDSEPYQFRLYRIVEPSDSASDADSAK